MRLLGYVATTYAKRNISLVRKDIETYAAWPTKSSNPALAVRGIFFDETPQQYDADALAYLEDLTEVVKNTEGFGPDPLVSPCLSRTTVTVSIAVFYVFPSRVCFSVMAAFLFLIARGPSYFCLAFRSSGVGSC